MHATSRRHADRIFTGGRPGRRTARPRPSWPTGSTQRRTAAGAGTQRAPAGRRRRARAALELCREIENAPRDETEASFAPFFREKLEKQLDPVKKTRCAARRSALLELAVERGTIAVERQALAALAGQGRRGLYAENWLWKSLFGLAFWDIVYAPVPGAFHHPFQYGPRDLDSPTFRPAREAAIAARLAELAAAADLRPRLMGTFAAKQGKANALVSWHPGSREAIELALELIEGPHLAKVADRLSRDLGRYRRGLPDLLVRKEGGRGFELWEVKAPGDQLRPEQKSWLDYLNAQGLPAGVLKLRWR